MVSWCRNALIILFVLFAVGNAAYLDRVPGLMGDEASEGENVFLLFDAKKIMITGERSYIGPLIDYVRVPFVLLFGYNALALRLLIFLFSLATFWLAVIVCRRLWGQEIGLVAATAMLFSPIYFTYQRIGWAITLFPFFALLVLYLLTLPKESKLAKHGPLLAGLVAGLGVHNHVLFLPTLVGVVVGWLVAMLFQMQWRRLFGVWPAAVGFFAGFGTQLAVMLLNRDDFRDAEAATSLIGDRFAELPLVLPQVISGSSFVARYSGDEFSPPFIRLVTWVLVLLATAALMVPRDRVRSVTAWRPRWAGFAWLIGLAALLYSLLYLIFQFSLRYFAMPVLGLWVLAGAGLGGLLLLVVPKRYSAWPAVASVLLAVVLTAWTISMTLVPFLQTGGATSEFSIGKRNDSAAALVDTRPLVKCLMGGEPVYSESVHIQNRLRYLSYDPRSDLDVVLENESKTRARWIVSYRLEDEENPNAEFEKCPELKHFKVIARDRG